MISVRPPIGLVRHHRWSLSSSFSSLSFQDGRSPLSSGAESDDSSGRDSPPPPPSVAMPVRVAVQPQQQQLSRLVEPNRLQGLVAAEKHANGNGSASGSGLATGSGAVSIRLNSSKSPSVSTAAAGASTSTMAGLVGTLSRLDGLISDLPSGMYPASAFQNIPPEIVMQLVEMGHLKFHSTEGENAQRTNRRTNAFANLFWKVTFKVADYFDCIRMFVWKFFFLLFVFLLGQMASSSRCQRGNPQHQQVVLLVS